MTYEGTYRPGSWAAATAPNGWLLADLAVTDERIAAVWTLLRADSDVDDLLDILLSQGLARLPSFALVIHRGDTLRVLVRGDAVVRVAGGAEDQVIDADGATWKDLSLSLPMDHIELRRHTDDSDLAGGSGVPVGLGIAQASMIDLTATPDPSTPAPPTASMAPLPAPATSGTAESLAPAAEPGPTPTDAVPHEPAPDPTPELEGGPDYSDLFAGTQDRDAFLARLAHDAEKEAGAADSDQRESEGAPAPPSPTGAVRNAAEPPAVRTAPSNDATAIWTGDLPDSEPLPAPPANLPTPPAPVAPASGLIDGLPWLNSDTNAPNAAPGVPTPPIAPPVAPAAPLPAPAKPLSDAPATPPPTDDGSAALTMSRAELLAAMGDHGVVGPSVMAVRCPTGHLTPPEQDRCRVCDAGVDAAEPTEVLRPTLGLLRSEAGETVQLDRDVIFGRSPQASASRAASQPNLVKVADPGISRNHVHVALDGWQVLVRDLGSSNGTEIQLPGKEIEKLRSGEDYLIEAGTLLVLAGDVRYTFEVTG